VWTPEKLRWLSPEEQVKLAEAWGIKAKIPDVPYLDWYKTTIPPNYGIYPHIEFICSLIDKVIKGDIKRLALSLPPGHGKSQTVTSRLPIYWGERHPKDAIVLTGYNQTFAEKNLSYPCREIAQEMGLLGKATALDEWYFRNNARLVARGVGSAPTGINPISLLIADDPIKDREQANSEVERENIWNWWIGSIVQRFWPETRAIIIATRWHEDDLIGRLKVQNTGEWTFVNVPAVAEIDDPIGRKEGQALWPEGKPRLFLDTLKLSDAYEFEALFQGNPTPKQGSFFKIGNLTKVDGLPCEPTRICRAWDIAATEGGGDYTVGVKIAECQGRYYVMDVRRGQWSTDERNKTILETAAVDGQDCMVRGPKEVGAAGKDFGTFFIRMMAGYPVGLSPVSKSKETRADPYSSQVNAGNVFLLRGAWNNDYVEELRQFPKGKHDDQVDASGDAFKAVALNRSAEGVQSSTHSTPPIYQPALQSGIPAPSQVKPSKQRDGMIVFRR
jgi:predicted phage terminase large subunit-like protein